MHCNNRSLSANFDNLQHMPFELYLPYSMMGLTEIKLKADQSFLPNIEMPSYLFTFEASLSNAGGVGFILRRIIYLQPDLILQYQQMTLRHYG